MPIEWKDFRLAVGGDVEDQVIHSSGICIEVLPNSDPILDPQMLIDCGAPMLDERVLWSFALLVERTSAVNSPDVGCWIVREGRSSLLAFFGVDGSLASLSSTKLSVSRSIRTDSMQTRLWSGARSSGSEVFLLMTAAGDSEAGCGSNCLSDVR